MAEILPESDSVPRQKSRTCYDAHIHILRSPCPSRAERERQGMRARKPGRRVPSDAPVRHANRPSGMRVAAELIEHERLEERKIELIVEYF